MHILARLNSPRPLKVLVFRLGLVGVGCEFRWTWVVRDDVKRLVWLVSLG